MREQRSEAADAARYWTRFRHVFHAIKAECCESPRLIERDRQAIGLAARFADAVCESEGLSP